ncbi:hypothetical protein F5Y14DRAFT_454753 [Nemania sp. NC0429]|nr:hypothetical protein F5Y14DRAFT_454753 [Nemania sp. NC0429]
MEAVSPVPSSRASATPTPTPAVAPKSSRGPPSRADDTGPRSGTQSSSPRSDPRLSEEGPDTRVLLGRDRDRGQRPRRTVKRTNNVADASSRTSSSDGDGGLRASYTGLAQDAPKFVSGSFLSSRFYERSGSPHERPHDGTVGPGAWRAGSLRRSGSWVSGALPSRSSFSFGSPCATPSLDLGLTKLLQQFLKTTFAKRTKDDDLGLFLIALFAAPGNTVLSFAIARAGCGFAYS